MIFLVLINLDPKKGITRLLQQDLEDITTTKNALASTKNKKLFVIVGPNWSNCHRTIITGLFSICLHMRVSTDLGHRIFFFNEDIILEVKVLWSIVLKFGRHIYLSLVFNFSDNCSNIVDVTPVSMVATIFFQQ
jgi:hypothetical protein